MKKEVKNCLEHAILSTGIRLRLGGKMDEFLTKLFWKKHKEMTKKLIDSIDISVKDIELKLHDPTK